MKARLKSPITVTFLTDFIDFSCEHMSINIINVTVVIGNK